MNFWPVSLEIVFYIVISAKSTIFESLRLRYFWVILPVKSTSDWLWILSVTYTLNSIISYVPTFYGLDTYRIENVSNCFKIRDILVCFKISNQQSNLKTNSYLTDRTRHLKRSFIYYSVTCQNWFSNNYKYQTSSLGILTALFCEHIQTLT